MSKIAAKILASDMDTILSDYVCKVPPMITELDINMNTPDLKEREQLLEDALARDPEAISTLKNLYGLTKMWDPITEEVFEL